MHSYIQFEYPRGCTGPGYSLAPTPDLATTLGTGKSEVNKAFLWYAYQLRASQLVVVTSYTWKAALLLGTPYNPGYSTTLLFGTNTGQQSRGRRRVPGTATTCLKLFTSSVRIILHDEISFDSQHHFQVRPASKVAILA